MILEMAMNFRIDTILVRKEMSCVTDMTTARYLVVTV